MSNGVLAAPQRRGAAAAAPGTAKLRSTPGAQRISGAFQLGLAIFIILTSALPTIIQGLAFGIEGSANTEFAAAMVTALGRDLLLLALLIALASQPLGLLHPLLIVLVVWPLLTQIPDLIPQLGGWGGVVAGLPVEMPYYDGLPSQSASRVWLAMAKYNALQILAFGCACLGFWIYKGRRNYTRVPPPLRNSKAVRAVLLVLLATSVLVLLVFVFSRGGLEQHLTSLGRGRFRELSGAGAVVVLTDLGVLALYVWIAARPSDAKSPLFLGALAVVTIAQFVSNGSRGQSLLVPITAGLIWALRGQKIPWRLGLVLLPLMFASLGLLGAVRSSVWTGSTAGEVFSTTSWIQSVTLAQEEVIHRRSTSANVPIVERGFVVTDGPLLGESYIAAVTAAIPRSLWEDKPRGPDSLYTQRFLGESRFGSGIPVSPEAEAYWNFGLPGVVLLSILYGVILRAAFHFYWRHFPNPFIMVFYALVLTRFHFATKGLVVFQQQSMLLLLCYLAVAFLVPRKSTGDADPSSRPGNCRAIPHPVGMKSHHHRTGAGW